MAERWFSKRELARELRVSVSTIERHVKPTLRVGAMNRYEMSDVRRQLAGDLPDNVTELRPQPKGVAA